MWTNLFYFLFLIVAITQDLASFINPEKTVEIETDFSENLKKDPKTAVGKHKGEMWTQGFYFFLNMIGLFSSQWIGFLLIFILAFIPKTKRIWVLADSLISILIVLFIILNKYHFHYDVLNLFR